jgi:hypothetical protein
MPQIAPGYAFNFFRSQGWSAPQAAGIVGNLQWESGLQTTRVGDSGAAIGAGQWHPDRQSIFQRLFGVPVAQGSADQQLQFVQYELTHNESRAGDILRQQTTVSGATSAFMNHFERPSAAARANSIAGRTNFAGQVAGAVGGSLGDNIAELGNEGQRLLENIPGMSALFGIRDNLLGWESPTGSCGVNPICYLREWISSSSFFSRLALALFAFIVIFAAFYLMKDKLES